MAEITDKKGRKLAWYKFVVKRYLHDLKVSIANSKNDMERSYYKDKYDCQLVVFAEALHVRPKVLEQYIK